MIRTNLKKPFPEFKWRWASFTPSEGLNDPRVYLGVLRAMRKHEGDSPSSASFLHELQSVENDLSAFMSSKLALARENDRNLLRNSQQYWSGLALLEATDPTIKLTDFGRKVADGDITQQEFAGSTIRTLELPNERIENPSISEKWKEFGIKLKPLTLILSIIDELGRDLPDSAFLTNEELTKVVIPLSSINASHFEHVEHIRLFRMNSPIFDSYEDFASGANDKRVSREFLLFLSFHGFLEIRNPGENNLRQQFFASDAARSLIRELLSLPQEDAPAKVAESISKYLAVGLVEREKRNALVTARPGQAKFRREVLSKSGNKCLLTGETMMVVLRACHIIPVEKNGSDDVGNGICLREDLHILFDTGHLRIDSTGEVHLSEHASASSTYNQLAGKIVLPAYVNLACIAHRWSYFN